MRDMYIARSLANLGGGRDGKNEVNELTKGGSGNAGTWVVETITARLALNRLHVDDCDTNSADDDGKYIYRHMILFSSYRPPTILEHPDAKHTKQESTACLRHARRLFRRLGDNIDGRNSACTFGLREYETITSTAVEQKALEILASDDYHRANIAGLELDAAPVVYDARPRVSTGIQVVWSQDARGA